MWGEGGEEWKDEVGWDKVGDEAGRGEVGE